ncbi:signal peptide peptidase SppA [Staphylococcus nepalensis]|jgi:protease-4|uniref:Signal peptide peptidase SppA n=1 Tax=Staphylococcus nepalensis TaxID=214473 RepID=A0A291JJW2_9STAP|nr:MULTISPECIES: signal peptide peptidase SppA [Staphylococcus]ATH59845.1 signal peptide peptidase SppA [Staphylococcus nepalensis]ATH64937.1 signal peptide peptidase SppA [Staphylococcus nepalensis]MBO1221602.1 signal peptide peptidase SppA [Staphylococcus nepalensis]MCD8891531.1 signal peptide peptidase SppA [Staphylococcus nepalensis]NWN86404.1 signal peptide peptidase SppA [Staphylococcus sp.]
MSKKRVIAIVLAVVIVLGGVVMSSISTVISSLFNEDSSSEMDPFTETVEKEGDATKRIAHLTLNGEIAEGTGGGMFGGSGYNHEAFLKQLDKVKKDSSIKGVLLSINTPGGGTYPSDEIYKKIKEIKQKHKKVYVHMESMAASGGYYIAAPSDKIYAGPQTTTGSIGVIMSNVDYSGLQEKLGVKENVIKSGKHKDIMSSSREMTSEEKDILQSVLDDSYERFVNIVEDGRDMSEEKVKKLADGRIYSAQQAKANGLIDEIGYKDNALKALKKDINAEDAEVFKYSEGGGWFSSLYSTKTTIGQFKNDLNELKSIIKNDTEAEPMYLYEG